MKHLTCAELVEQLTDLLDDALDDEARKRLVEHLGYCEGCDEYLRQFELTVGALGSLTVEAADPPARPLNGGCSPPTAHGDSGRRHCAAHCESRFAAAAAFKGSAAHARHMFLNEPPSSAAGAALYNEDRDSQGYVDNLTRLWCWRPELMQQFSALRRNVMTGTELSAADIAVLDVATAAARESAYCALAKGSNLATLTDPESAAAVAAGAVDGLDPRTAALATWAKLVAGQPSRTTADDLQPLRELGLSDREIFDATMVVGLRLMFATVNDALGAEPDAQLAQRVPPAISAAVGYGRTPAEVPST